MDVQANPFIFYLTLDDSLPGSFYIFDRTLRELGFILVPVKIDQLQTLVSSTEQEQVIVLSSVTDSRELKLYNERVRGLLKYILKSPRITFLQLSSFSRINDSRTHAFTRNYFFMKCPLDARALSQKIARYHENRVQRSTLWPGGKRAGVKSLVV